MKENQCRRCGGRVHWILYRYYDDRLELKPALYKHEMYYMSLRGNVCEDCCTELSNRNPVLETLPYKEYKDNIVM